MHLSRQDFPFSCNPPKLLKEKTPHVSHKPRLSSAGMHTSGDSSPSSSLVHDTDNSMFVRPRDLGVSYQRGRFDLLIISKKWGFILGEIRTLGDLLASSLVAREEELAVVRKKLRKIVAQLDKEEMVLCQLTKDLQVDLPVTKVRGCTVLWVGCMLFHHQGVCPYCWHTCSSPSCLFAYLSVTKGLVCIPVRHQGACLHTCPSPRGLFAYLSVTKGLVCIPVHHQGACWHTCPSPRGLLAYLSVTKGLVCIPVHHQGACWHTCPSPRGLLAYLSITKGFVCIPVHHQGAHLYVCPPPKCVFVLVLHVACLPVITKVLVYTGLYRSIIMCLSVRQVLYAAVYVSRYSTAKVLVCNTL